MRKTCVPSLVLIIMGKKIKNMNACSKHRGDLNSHGQTSLSVIQPALFLNVCGLCMSEGACGRTFVYNR